MTCKPSLYQKNHPDTDGLHANQTRGMYCEINKPLVSQQEKDAVRIMSYCIGAKRHQLKPNLKICSQDDVSRGRKGVESYKVSMDTRCFCSGRFQSFVSC